MEERISDFKATLYQLQLKFEKKPTLHIVAIVLYGTVTIILTLVDLFTALSIAPRIVLSLIILIMVFVLFYIDWVHVDMIRKQRFDLDHRRKFIRELISTQPCVYRVIKMREYYNVEEDGDCMYVREMVLRYDGSDINWAELWLGTTNQYGNNFSQMILHVKSYPGEQPLSRLPIQETGSRLRYAIILKDKITKLHETEGYQVTMKWLEIWKSLMESLKDDGTLRIEHIIDEYSLEILLPPGYSFRSFSMPKTSGKKKIIQKDGRWLLTYKLSNLNAVGEQYDYFIEITK